MHRFVHTSLVVLTYNVDRTTVVFPTLLCKRRWYVVYTTMLGGRRSFCQQCRGNAPSFIQQCMDKRRSFSQQCMDKRRSLQHTMLTKRPSPSRAHVPAAPSV